MQSLGELLSSARTEKGYSIDQVAHETNISKNYIEYLEQEQFDQFPAEAYLIGFLRNYSEYLGMDSEKTISLYKNHKLSEEPAPIEELVGRKKKNKKIPVLWILLLLLIVGLVFLGIKLVPVIKAKAESNRQAQEAAQNLRSPQSYQVEKGEQEFLILQDDTLLFTKEDLTYTFKVEDRQDHFELIQEESGTGESYEYSLRLGKEVFLSLFSDTPDFRLVLSDYGLSSGEGKLSVFQLESANNIEREEEEQELPTLAEVETAPPSSQGTNVVEPEVILTLATPERFTLDIQFRGYSLYRYELDNRERNERYYRDGDAFRLDVNRKIQLWLSNAGAAYTKVNGQEVNLGKPGEVTVKSIQWIKNDQGTYDLVLIPVY